MSKIGKIFNRFTIFLGNKPKKMVDATQARKKQTQIIKNLNGEIIRLEREFCSSDGKTYLCQLESTALSDYKKISSLKVYTINDKKDNNLKIFREKTITRHKHKSLLGGNKITVNKHYYATQNMPEYNETLLKEYGKTGNLEHKDLTRKYNHWIRAEHSTQDRISKDAPLNHSAKDMYAIDPLKHQHYLHELDGTNNYEYFSNQESNLKKLNDKKDEAITKEIKKVENLKLEAFLKYHPINEESKNKMPLIDSEKLLGINIKDLTLVKKYNKDGSVTKSFYRSQAAVACKKPLIKIIDKDNIHQEWIRKNPIADMIYIKQIGNNKPYIIAKKGNYTQIQNADEKIQYYYDNQTQLKRNYDKHTFNDAIGKIQIYDNTATEKRTKYPDIAEYFPDCQTIKITNGIIDKESALLPIVEKQVKYTLNKINRKAEKNLICFEDLFNF